MISGHVFIATSLDGFIARDNGDIGWLMERNEPGENYGYDSFIADIDVIVLGRGSFLALRDVKPWLYTLPVVVLSASLTQDHVPDDLKDKVEICDKPPKQVMQMLQSRGCRRVYVDGGRVVQSFLAERLIADMVITRVPVLLGQGRSLFGAIPEDIPLVHEKTETFPPGFVQSRYKIAG